MTTLPPDGPVTRREFYLEMTVVWLFILLISTAGIDRSSDWRAMLVPVGALLILALHSIESWKAARRHRAAGQDAA